MTADDGKGASLASIVAPFADARGRDRLPRQGLVCSSVQYINHSGTEPRYPPRLFATRAPSNSAARKDGRSRLALLPGMYQTCCDQASFYRVTMLQEIILFAIYFVIFGVPVLWVLQSRRSHGGAKFGWLIITLFFSWIGLAVFLIATQARKNQSGVR
jgi:hypothetical protein